MEKFKKLDIFLGLNEKEIMSILSAIEYKIITLDKDEMIFFREEKMKGLHIVLKGRLSADMIKEDGKVQKIEEFVSGQTIGAAFVFGEMNRMPVDLITEEKSEILIIDKENLLKGFEKNSKFLINYLNEISNKAQFLAQKIWKGFNVKTIKEKVEEYIVENQKNNQIEIKSIKGLAEKFGVSRPSLSRVIGNLIDEEKIIRKEKNIFIIKK